MWEIIESNKRKSVVLLTVMAMLMIGVGMIIGGSYAPHSGGFITGAVIAFIIWIVLSLVSYYSGDSIFLASAGAKEIQREDHPTLWNIVEEMKIASGLTNMPRVYIIDDPRPNAFATGRDPEHASIAVTAGLLNRLNRDEVQGVVAHEMAHIQNRDILYVMMAAVMIGVIALMSDLFLRSLRFTGGRTRSRGKGGGQLQIILLVLAIVFAILGPIAAQMLYFAISRRREYLADACGAQYTRYPEGLASALEKISGDPGGRENKNRAMAPMYIINPMAAASLGSTHPPTEERIRILRSMGSGASLVDYEQAYQKAKNAGIVPSSALKRSIPVGVRPAWEKQSVESEQKAQSARQEQISRARETTDALWRIQNYAFIACTCGVKLKVPPNFKGNKVKCPRCQTIHDVQKVA